MTMKINEKLRRRKGDTENNDYHGQDEDKQKEEEDDDIDSFLGIAHVLDLFKHNDSKMT